MNRRLVLTNHQTLLHAPASSTSSSSPEPMPIVQIPQRRDGAILTAQPPAPLPLHAAPPREQSLHGAVPRVLRQRGRVTQTPRHVGGGLAGLVLLARGA
jgi:hypothetical protein